VAPTRQRFDARDRAVASHLRLIHHFDLAVAHGASQFAFELQALADIRAVDPEDGCEQRDGHEDVRPCTPLPHFDWRRDLWRQWIECAGRERGKRCQADQGEDQRAVALARFEGEGRARREREQEHVRRSRHPLDGRIDQCNRAYRDQDAVGDEQDRPAIASLAAGQCQYANDHDGHEQHRESRAVEVPVAQRPGQPENDACHACQRQDGGHLLAARRALELQHAVLIVPVEVFHLVVRSSSASTMCPRLSVFGQKG